MKKAVLAIAAEFERPYLREWADWHHSLGFDDIWIVTNNWDLDEPVPEYVKTYRRDGKVQQLPVYNEWMSLHRKEYSWALVCDIDEFLWMPGDLDKWLLDNCDDYCIGIPWVHFGDGTMPKSNNGIEAEVPTEGSVVQRFQRCEGVYNRHVKPLINLVRLTAADRVFFVNPHFACVNKFWLPWNDIFGKQMNGPYNTFEGKQIDETKPFLAHFYTKTITEWRKRRGPEHMRADCAQFVTEDWFAKENHNEVGCSLLAEKQMKWGIV